MGVARALLSFLPDQCRSDPCVKVWISSLEILLDYTHQCHTPTSSSTTVNLGTVAPEPVPSEEGQPDNPHGEPHVDQPGDLHGGRPMDQLEDLHGKQPMEQPREGVGQSSNPGVAPRNTWKVGPASTSRLAAHRTRRPSWTSTTWSKKHERPYATTYGGSRVSCTASL